MRSAGLPCSAALVLVTCAVIGAQPPTTPCAFNGSFTDVKLAEVATAKSVTAYGVCGPGKDCPMTLQPGDPVVMNRAEGDWTCGYFTDWKGVTQGSPRGWPQSAEGWVRSQDIAPVNFTKNPASTAWLGTWVQGRNSIGIQNLKAPGKLSFSGKAYKLGPEDVINTGQFSGQASPRGNQVHLIESGANSCAVDLTLAGKYLLVNDNDRCSTTSVRFGGIWKRAPAASK